MPPLTLLGRNYLVKCKGEMVGDILVVVIGIWRYLLDKGNVLIVVSVSSLDMTVNVARIDVRDK